MLFAQHWPLYKQCAVGKSRDDIKNSRENFLETPRIKPRAVGCEVWLLPLFYAAPMKSYLTNIIWKWYMTKIAMAQGTPCRTINTFWGADIEPLKIFNIMSNLAGRLIVLIVFFPPPFPHIALISVFASQIVLQGFFCDSSLFASAMTSQTCWSTWQQALCERENAHSGGEK